MALILLGPSKLFGLHIGSLALTIFGLIFLGIGASALFVPLLPDIIESIQLEYALGENPNLLSKAANAFNTAQSLGCIIAPILGGLLNQKYGF